MTSHEQVWVKVNAPVDCGAAGIVEALSAFTGLETAAAAASRIVVSYFYFF